MLLLSLSDLSGDPLNPLSLELRFLVYHVAKAGIAGWCILRLGELRLLETRFLSFGKRDTG